MSTAVIKDNHIKVTTIKFFKGNAPVIEIGCYGEKKTPLLSGNYLERQDRLPAPKIDGIIRKATAVEIDTTSTTKSNFLANVDVTGVFGVSSDTAWKRAKKGYYKLVWFVIDPVDLEDAFNKSPKARGNLASYGADARAVHQVFIAMEAKEADRVATGSRFDVSVKAGALNVNVKGGSNGSTGTNITIAPGTCYAYLLAKPKWENGKSQVKKFTDDQWSLN